MFTSRTIFTVILAIASPALLAHPLEPNLEQHVEHLEVEGHHANLVGYTISASDGLITQRDIEMRPLLRTGEVLESIPGLIATQHSGSGKANQYFLRGFNLDHGTDFATFIDGMPVNMRSHGHGQGYTDLNFLIPELIGNITYRKGPYYAGVGDFSGAGSAHIESATTLDNGKISLGLGDFGYQRALLLGNYSLSKGDLILGLEQQRYSGPWQDIDEDLNTKKLWLKQIWKGDNANLGVSLMAYDNSWNSADQIPERAVQSGLINELGSIDKTLGGESSRYSLSLNGEIQGPFGKWKTNVYAIDYDMKLWSNFTYFTEETGDQFQQVDDRQIYGVDLSWTHQSRWASFKTENTLGLETRHDDIREVALNRTQSRQRIGTIRSDSIREMSHGLWWQNKILWTPSLRTVLGLRHDRFDFDVAPKSAAIDSTLTENSGEDSDAINTAKASVIYTLNSDQEIYASIGQGFHSNDARGTTISRDPTNNQLAEPVDPLVDTLGYEIGWRAVFGDWLNTSVALWHLEIDSELLYVGDAGTTEDTGSGSSREGIEITAYWRPTTDWTIDLEYAYSNAEFDNASDGEKAIPGALKHVASAGVQWQASDTFFAHLRTRYFGEYPLDGGQTANSGSIVNLRMGYEISPRFNITLDALNLLDSKDHDIEYFYESQLASETSPVEDRHYHVFEPRSLRVAVTFEL